MKVPRNKETQITMSTANTQILVFKYHSSLKGTGLLRKMAASRPGTSCDAMKQESSLQEIPFTTNHQENTWE